MKKIFYLLLIVAILIPNVFAFSSRQGHMYLLAVKESGDEMTGSVADLYLEIRPGTGRVFLETYPLSKLDTQISTRFAKEIACSYLETDCSVYDFFYIIKADSPVIAGPSAGAALTVLTVSLLSGTNLRNDTVITGTINSGGLIGPVSGIREKIDAASKISASRILIPDGTRFDTDKLTNLTIDMQDYAKKYNLNVIETGDLTDALYYFTGKRFKEKKEFSINENYLKTMSSVAEMLCSRSEILAKDILFDVKKPTEKIAMLEKSALNFTEKGKNAINEKNYYSAASFCFSANTNLREIEVIINENKNFDEIRQKIKKRNDEIASYPIKTITDLETYMIVIDRLDEAAKSLNESIEQYNNNKSYSRSLAFAIERLYTADAWAKFFGTPGKEFVFDEQSLKNSCMAKIAEAEELYQYAALFFIPYLQGSREKINDAYQDYQNNDYVSCLFKASNVKADMSTVVGAIGVEDKEFDSILENKMDIIKQVIYEQQEKGIFPILGYSYYEYAKSFKKDDKYSALVYSSYALELSNLDIYFKKQKEYSILKNYFARINWAVFFIFILGAFLGFVLSYLIFKKELKEIKNKRNKLLIKIKPK